MDQQQNALLAARLQDWPGWVGNAGVPAPQAANRPSTLSVTVSIATTQYHPQFRRNHYVITNDMANRYSPVMHAAYLEVLRAGGLRRITLPDYDHPEAFSYIQHWLYTRQLSIPEGVDDASHLLNCCATWILADRLQMHRLQNAIVTLMFTKLMPINKHVVSFVYTQFSRDQFGDLKECKLRSLLADRAASEIYEDDFEEMARSTALDVDYVVDVTLAYKRDCEMLRNHMHGWILPPAKVLLEHNYKVEENVAGGFRG